MHGGVEQGLARLTTFLKLAKFPNERPEDPHRFEGIIGAKLIVEQSFSDFGHPDLLILLDYEDERKGAVFIEAKVKTAQNAFWLITDEWEDFLQSLAAQRSSSNLFQQLYRKMRLRTILRKPNEFDVNASVPSGWSRGQNPVVLEAAEKLRDYCERSWYLMIVPEGPATMSAFAGGTLRDFNAAELTYKMPDWCAERCGYLCWHDLDVYCALENNHQNWPGVIRNFKRNKGQIYGANAENAQGIGNIEMLLDAVTTAQRALLLVSAENGGEMAQGPLLLALRLENANVLRAQKASVNRACDQIGIPRMLPPGFVAGNARMHGIRGDRAAIRDYLNINNV